MPVYEYSCSTCGRHFEKNIRMNETPGDLVCPRGHATVKRVYSATPVMFRGSGFYVTDHRSKNSGDAHKD